MSVFQIRHKMMDYFTKQTWKTIQQHIKAINQKIQEYRSVLKIPSEIS